MSATSQTASREKRSEQLKSYCKGLRIDGALISRAYESWLDAPAGKKNAWRVPDEHGSAESLIAEIESEIASRTLALRPIKRYRHREPTNGKLRIIGVESVKQQICDYVAIEARRGSCKGCCSRTSAFTSSRGRSAESATRSLLTSLASRFAAIA